MEFLQLRLQRLEVTDGLLKGKVRAQRLQLHKVSTDVVKTHVSESAPEMEGKQTVKLSLLWVLRVLVKN